MMPIMTGSISSLPRTSSTRAPVAVGAALGQPGIETLNV
ncbi:MAG: hypothetical protein JWQ60_4318 [Pseudonocardia sp.]|nr:hypothetical protein [Pseudonocardia sp.]